MLENKLLGLDKNQSFHKTFKEDQHQQEFVSTPVQKSTTVYHLN